MGSHPLRRGWSRLAGAALAASVSGALLTAAALPSAALADDPIGGPELGGAGFVVDTTPGVPALPTTTSTAFVVADAETGAVLAAHNPHQKLAPASTLKELTALTLIPRVPPTLPTMAQSDAPRIDGTKAGIVAGTTYKVDDLFTAMLMMSANDAAIALADANGGVPATLAQMNDLAAHLQANDTVAMTTSGLDAPGQTSSAYDLALIFRAGLALSQFRHYLLLKTADFPAPKGQTFQIQTHDRLLQSYPGMIGGKNGYTVAAQASYVGAASRGGHTIIVAVMRDQANFWPEVQTLLDWGFAADGVATPVGELVGPFVPKPPQPVSSATTPAQPQPAAAAAGPAAALTKARTTGSDAAISAVLIWAAVGVAGLFFLAACWQLAAHRRRFNDTDERYLNGLARLSVIDLSVTEADELSKLT
jgi:D-alanyl-D-alanine carboxypeptidase (penicillin-binding protein 5/6)